MNVLDAITVMVMRVAKKRQSLEAAMQQFDHAHGEMNARWKVAAFVALMRGHNIDRREMRRTQRGVVIECSCCGMVADVPRHPWPGEKGFKGRALEFRCPSNRDAKGTLR